MPVAFVLMLPLAAMGVPFPVVLHHLGKTRESLLRWAWERLRFRGCRSTGYPARTGSRASGGDARSFGMLLGDSSGCAEMESGAAWRVLDAEHCAPANDAGT